MKIKELYKTRDEIFKKKDALLKTIDLSQDVEEVKEQLKALDAEADELTVQINEYLDSEIKNLSDKDVPEMPFEGHKNMLLWLLKKPSPEEVRKELPMLKQFAANTYNKKGWDLLSQAQQSNLTKQLEASNYLLSLALEILGEEAKYDILPQGDYLHVWNLALAGQAKKRQIQTTKNGTKKNDRHKLVEYEFVEGLDGRTGYKVKQTDDRSGQIIELVIWEPKGMNGKGVNKCYKYLLVQANNQNFNPVIGFPLQDLVDNGMYASVENARTGIKNALNKIMHIEVGGQIKKGNKTIQQRNGILFYDWEIKNNFVKVSLNENVNIDFIAPYWAPLPKFIFALDNTQAFDLCEYVFVLARQNHRKIGERGYFTIGLKSIRDRLMLPTAEAYAEEGKKFKPKQYVMDPIMSAIDEIKETAAKQDYTELKVEVIHDNPNPKGLDEWLTGYLKVTVSGELHENLTTMHERQQQKIETAKKNARLRKEKKGGA